MSAEPTAVARQKWEIVGGRDAERLAEVYGEDSVSHQPDADLNGLEEAKAYLSLYLTAFPDLSASVEEVLGDGDTAVSRWTLRGTHRGDTDAFGPATGRAIELEGISIHRVTDGRIAEEWERYDNLGVMQQLGLLPEE